MRLLIVFLGLLLASCLSSVAFSEQISPEDILKQAQEKANQINKYRELLSNPDQNVRVAALDAMLKSNDPAVREIAFNIAFASVDAAMRGIALRNKFLYMKTLNFSLEPRESATKEEKEIIAKKFANIYSCEIREYDSNSGNIIFSNSSRRGQINGTSLSFTDDTKQCHANLVLGDGVSELEGTLNCTYSRYLGSYIIKLQLQ